MSIKSWPAGYRWHRVAHIPLGSWCYAVTPEGQHLEPCKTEQEALQSAIDHASGPTQPAADAEKDQQHDLF